MQFTAKTRHTRYSPFKLRPLADVIRGKSVDYALRWLATSALKRATPIKKMIESAAANAKQLKNVERESLIVKEIRVDQGPTVRYFKPGAMGRANVQKKRFSHLSVILEPKGKKKEVSSGPKS